MFPPKTKMEASESGGFTAFSVARFMRHASAVLKDLHQRLQQEVVALLGVQAPDEA